MRAADLKAGILRFCAGVVKRARRQRSLDWMLIALLPAAATALFLDLTGASALLSATLPLVLPVLAFAAGGLIPVDERRILLEVDRRLHLKEALITAAAIAAREEPPTVIEELQLTAALARLETIPSDVIRPWRPTLFLPAAPLVLLLTVLLISLPPLGAGGEDTTAAQLNELSRRLAARSEETGDERFSELADLLERHLSAEPAAPGASAAREAEPPAAEDLSRTPSPTDGAGEEFAFDSDLEALFRLEPRLTEEGYALGRALAESLSLSPGDAAELEERLRDLDRRATGESPPGESPGSAGSAGGGDPDRSARGGDAGGESGETGDGERAEGESSPGGGTGSSPGERSDEEYTPTGEELGALESLDGEVSGDEQLRGAMRYLSPEGRSLIEESGEDPEYMRMRQSPRRDREERAGYESYIGDYFRLLYEQAAAEEDEE